MSAKKAKRKERTVTDRCRREANAATRAIVVTIEKDMNINIHLSTCMCIVGLVALAWQDGYNFHLPAIHAKRGKGRT